MNQYRIGYEITGGALPITVTLYSGSTGGLLINSNVHHLYETGEFTNLVNGDYTLYFQDSLGCNSEIDVVDFDGTSYYGIEFDITNPSPTLTRIGSNMDLHKYLPAQNTLKGCLINDDLSINYYLNSTDWTKKEDGSSSILNGDDGQVMIRKTKPLYWRFETEGNIRRVMVSMGSLSGYTMSPVWNIGAYEASLNRINSKLSSVINTTTDFRGGDNNSTNDANSKGFLGKPATSISRTSFRTYARNRGTGWNQIMYNSYLEMFWLFAIEYATFNSQLPVNGTLDGNGYKQGGLGNGVTTSNGTEWNNFNGYNPFVNCGSSNSLGNGSGEVNIIITDFGGSGVNRTVTVNRYRGIENPFGHIWKWIDGANIYNNAGTNELYIIDNPTNLSDNTSTNSRSAGNISSSSGWGVNLLFGNSGDIISSTVGGSSSTYTCDYSYVGTTSSTWYALLVGGYGSRLSGVGFIVRKK